MIEVNFVYSDVEQDKFLDGPYAIIKNLQYYIDNQKEIHKWMIDNNGKHSLEGVVLQFANRDIQTMFKLRWENNNG